LSTSERAVRRPLVLVLALVAATWAGTASAGSVTRQAVPPTQHLAALLTAHEAFAKPTAAAASRGRVLARLQLTGERTVLPVLGHRTGTDGFPWLHVRLPGRPNGRTGWIRARGTVAWRTSWHIVVSTSSRRVRVYRHGKQVRVFSAIVGKSSTPTPHGRFYVEEVVQMRSYEAGAPFALALSARSNVLQEFAGGPGQIALHGLSNVGGVLGSAVSHGCVRLADGAMRWLVLRIGPGVPVTIRS
jgi:lipoprotein-anchoring transpeptidase ErfK/SrfK